MTSELDLIFGPSPELSPAPAPLPEPPSAARFTIVRGEYVAHCTIGERVGLGPRPGYSFSDSHLVRWWDEALVSTIEYAENFGQFLTATNKEFEQFADAAGVPVTGSHRDLVQWEEGRQGYYYPHQNYRKVNGFDWPAYNLNNTNF